MPASRTQSLPLLRAPQATTAGSMAFAAIANAGTATSMQTAHGTRPGASRRGHKVAATTASGQGPNGVAAAAACRFAARRGPKVATTASGHTATGDRLAARRGPNVRMLAAGNMPDGLMPAGTAAPAAAAGEEAAGRRRNAGGRSAGGSIASGGGVGSGGLIRAA